MNNKQLAEMIKSLHKQKLDEYRSRSMSQPHPRKGNLTPAGHISHSKMTDITKAGSGLTNKYKPGRLVSEKKQDSNTKSTIINTTPEQDSAMIGTQ